MGSPRSSSGYEAGLGDPDVPFITDSGDAVHTGPSPEQVPIPAFAAAALDRRAELRGGWQAVIFDL